MNLREKYGEWGIILGATEGVGKAFAEKIASEGMSVVLVGRREEKLQELGKSISETYGVDHMVIRADFAQSDCTDKIFEATKDLDMLLPWSILHVSIHLENCRILHGRSMSR